VCFQEMGTINGAQLVVKALKNENVSVIFTLCGDDDVIYRYAVDAGIRLVDFRHEQATGHAAQAWSIATGEVGVCLTQSGPGFTDLVPSITVAYASCIPVVALTSQTPMSYTHKLPANEFDAVKLYEHFTKWADVCWETPRIPEYINLAFRHAAGGRPGPVLLSLPLDVLVKTCDEDLECIQQALNPREKNRTFVRPGGDPDAIKEALKLLTNAKRPLIIAGTGAGLSGASKELVEFVELTKIPTGDWGWGIGSIPYDHPLAMGPASVLAGPGAALLPSADVVLALGIRFTDLYGFGQPPVFSPDVKMIQVDICAEEIGRNRPIDVGIVADVKTCLKQLIQLSRETLRQPRVESDWVNKMRSEKQKFEQQIAKEGSVDSIPIKPQRLCKEIRDFMPRDSIVILDGGDTTVWGLTYLRAYYPKHLYFSGGLFIQHLGGGVPMGLASKLANPDKKVLVLTGDGSFLFNGKEIESARRQDIPFVIVVANDRLWGMVARIQQIAYGKKYFGVGSKLSDKTRYDKYAEAFDCYGELVTDPKQIRPALQRAFDSKKPAVLDVRIDPNVTSVLDYVSATAYDPRTYERKVAERKPVKKEEEEIEEAVELVAPM